MPPAVRLRPEIVREKLALRAAAFRPVRGRDVAGRLRVAAERRRALDPLPPARARAPASRASIRPYALVLAGRDWMVLAEDQSQQVKNFYLARIGSPRLTAERYAIPKDFDADAFFRNTFGLFVGKGRAFRFRVRFSPEVSGEVREMVWHPQQKIETGPDGEAILELPAESLREARRFILAYGRHARPSRRPSSSRICRGSAERWPPMREEAIPARAARRKPGRSRTSSLRS